MYSILRTKKIKSRSDITAMSEHNFRIRTQININEKLTPNNVVMFNSLGVDAKKASDLQEKLTAYYEGLGVKERKNNVLGMEFVVSASPEFFQGKTEADIKIWANAQVKFFKEEYGEQLKMGVLHLDEATPHLHFFIGTEMKSMKKYKNQKGEFHKESWSLNADRYNPGYLTELQTKYAEFNARFGLKRGKKGSKTIHKDLKDYYRELSQKIEENEKLTQIKKKASDLFPKLKAEILESYKRIDVLITMLEGKELTPEEEKIMKSFMPPKEKKSKPKN